MDTMQNKYSQVYYRIIENAQKENRTKTEILQYEQHHIIPRSLGGGDNSENLVLLTIREHFVCHRLLPKFLSKKADINKMFNALKLMSHKSYRRINSHVYEYIRKNIDYSRPTGEDSPNYNRPCPPHVKKFLSELHMGKKRPSEHCDAMKAGIAKNNPNGRIPWNKGKTGLKQKTREVTLRSADGAIIAFTGLRVACRELNLPESKMSSVRSGKLAHYKGWTVIDNN